MSTEWQDEDLIWEEESDQEADEFADEDMIVERLEDLEPDDDLTTDELEATEEGIPYRAPSDPPVVPSDDLEGVDIGAGFAPSMEETHPDSEEVPQRVEMGDLELQQHVCTVLRENSETAHLTDIEVLVTRGIVVLRGPVSDEQDIAIVDEIVGDLDGVREVRNELRVADENW